MCAVMLYACVHVCCSAGEVFRRSVHRADGHHGVGLAWLRAVRHGSEKHSRSGAVHLPALRFGRGGCAAGAIVEMRRQDHTRTDGCQSDGIALNCMQAAQSEDAEVGVLRPLLRAL